MTGYILEAARRYLTEGLALTPLNGKTPILTAWQAQPMPTDADLVSWFATGNHNIGIRTGLISRIIGIDIDATGKEVFNQTTFSSSLKDKIANTRMTRTGGGGYHILFRFSLNEFPQGVETVKLWHKAGVKGEILLQGNNRQVVSPPSIHPETKRPYESNGKDLLEITEAGYLELLAAFGKAPKGEAHYFQGPVDEPEYSNKLAPKKMQQALKLLLPHYTKGSRHDIVFSLAGTYRKAGVPLSNTEMFVTMLGNAAGDDRGKLADNLRVVREQYKRDISLPIAGRRMLKELLSS